ncbi:CRISPR-associated helicase Cas3' [Thermodesulfovibrionales bacterium]|nr:CRISPR-associated helicase Cas3' [Thermodesulfovibrionales bacterium]MCL0074888.1 CRISPR-associated helicase Cas3' [Thermodesulfovibrionales bacterium]
MTFYAKPDQTYREHLEAVYSAWKETVDAKRPLIERVAKKYNFPVERFLIGSLSTIAFHDIGKMIEPFQRMMLAIRQDKSFNRKTNYRHELVSFIYIAKYWQIINRDNYLSCIPLEALAVVGHHKTLNSDLTSFNRESIVSLPKVLPDGIMEAILIAEELFKKEGLTLPTVRDSSKYEDPYKSLSGLVSSGLLSKGIVKDGTEKIRVLYFLLKGILHYADWYGSGKTSVQYSARKDAATIIDELANRCDTKGIEYKGLRPFQETCNNYSGHLIAVAPTGSGKTEASILWALKNAKEMGGAKIIYLLPTMVTANSIWKRMVDFFGEGNVGLTHSTANLFLQNDSTKDEEDIWENRRDILFNQSFIKPITVGTVDQLLTVGFNSGKWVLKEVNASNSVIIMDEIHAYDGWTLGLIISAIRHFSSLGARFMLMSATLPSSLRQLFSKELFINTVIKEETLLSAKKSTYFIEDGLMENALENIEQAVLNGKRVLVVANTVKLCQSLAQKLSRLKPICYHSQFILKDRKTIEEKINAAKNDAKFVIATQVVEVSLDIDYDWLFTECAPPDAIVQRAGRVNRYRDSQKDSRVYIFKASEKSEKIYSPINDSNLLSRSFEAFKEAPEKISEEGLIELVEKVYKDYRIEDSESFNDALQQYRLSQSNRNMIFDSRLKEDKQEDTRQTKYETVSVIPKCFKEDVLGLKPADRRWYEIKIPLWYVRKNKEEVKGITFCDVDYDSNIGAIFTKDAQVSSMII